MWDETLSPLMEALPVGVLWMDGAGTLVRANRAGLEYLDLDSDAIGRNDVAGLVDSDTLRAALKSPGDGLVRLDFTQGARALSGEVRPIAVNGTSGKLLVLSDLTFSRHLPLLRQNFFFDLLHKVRTPLTTILSVLSMATSDRLDPSRVDLKEILGMGVMEADRLTELLTRLKELYLVETGGLNDDLLLEAVPVGELVNEVLDRLKRHHADRNHDVEVEIPEEDLPARADRDRLGRAVEFVLENAFQYTPPGGRILVAVSRSGPRIEIRVEDDGVGISPEDLPHVFGRFVSIDSSGLRPTGGEGLGLHLARHFLLAQKATLLLDSKSGVGTVAEIHLDPAEDSA